MEHNSFPKTYHEAMKPPDNKWKEAFIYKKRLLPGRKMIWQYMGLRAER
jgi:hypothetical protein